MRVLAFAAAASLVLLASCDNQTEPSAPPTAQEALTTTTEVPAATSRDAEPTTEAAPTTVAPSPEEATEADGPPTMPAEAEEQTEAGAEAFALHYLDLLNYTAQHPKQGVLEALSSAECGTCGQFAESVANLSAAGERYESGLAEYRDSTAVQTEESAVVTVTVNQPNLEVVTESGDVVRTYPAEANVRMEFHLAWEASSWQVSRIFLVEQ